MLYIDYVTLVPYFKRNEVNVDEEQCYLYIRDDYESILEPMEQGQIFFEPVEVLQWLITADKSEQLSELCNDLGIYANSDNISYSFVCINGIDIEEEDILRALYC